MLALPPGTTGAETEVPGSADAGVRESGALMEPAGEGRGAEPTPPGGKPAVEAGEGEDEASGFARVHGSAARRGEEGGGALALGSVFDLPARTGRAGPEVHVRGRAAPGGDGAVTVHVPGRVEDADGRIHGADALDLDGPERWTVHLDAPLERPVRLRLRRRGLPGPGGDRGDVILDVVPDASIVPVVAGARTRWPVPVSIAVAVALAVLVLIARVAGCPG
ncbi:MAG: hypothetical protein EA398_00370 [Deltaproteobacteria bacterium]|nr:MAG: hypothetical protein EA398_00370 [Deltaproteobacteria bacterium]